MEAACATVTPRGGGKVLADGVVTGLSVSKLMVNETKKTGKCNIKVKGF